MKNIISKMKNTVEGIQSRLDEAEDWIKELKGKVVKNSQAEQQNKQTKNPQKEQTGFKRAVEQHEM